MIAASEPLEFVPHGRTVLAKHPTQIYAKGHNTSVSENSLLYKLTNFAIKDESLVEAKDEDYEWWTIREVYYKDGDDFDDDTQSSKEQTSDYSESFRPASRLKNEFSISIKHELLSGIKKATECQSGGTSRGGSADSSSNMSKKFNLNSGQNKIFNKKPLNPKTDCSYEEELYVKGCTAVWSKARSRSPLLDISLLHEFPPWPVCCCHQLAACHSYQVVRPSGCGLISTPSTKLSAPEHRETIACYTIDNPIKHAAFVNFHITINNTMLIDALNSQIGDVKRNIKVEDTTEHVQSKIMPSILLVDTKCMKVFATDGREYVTNIPFQIKKVWPMKYGVLLEKDATPLLHNSFLHTSFVKLNESLNSTFTKSRSNHPFNMSAKLRAESVSGYEQDVPLPTCFSLTHPLDEVTPVLMKSPTQGLQYYNDGDVQIIFVSTNPSIILLYDWKLNTHSLWKIRKASRDECLSMCPNMNSTTTVFSQSCDFIGTPTHSNVGRNTTNWMTGISSPLNSRKGLGTPTMSRSRLNSPLANAFHQHGMSPHGSIGQASMSMANTMVQGPPSLPLYPDVCLDHIWTDNQSVRRDTVENLNDTKTFLHTDLVGHDYLCFMVKSGGVSRLHIVRLQKSHSLGQSSKTNLIVGAVSVVLAKDVVVLDHLKMFALIDDSGNIILQSGNHIVGKVHIGGVLARLLESPASWRQPFPRRSSLLPMAREAALDDSALHLLSPVPHTNRDTTNKETLGLRSLRDPAGSRFTLQFEGGSMYRLALPALTCSSLVARCCLALKAILPRDITMQVLIKWYGSRNALGTQDLSPHQEWGMFSEQLLALLGYAVDKLARPKPHDDQVETAEVATKKQRTSSDGTTEDWDYLLNSKMHKMMGNSIASMLNINLQSSTSIPETMEESTTEEKQAQFNTNALLFPFTYQVLYAFHLVYEEIKLNTLLWGDLKLLSQFLYQVSKDLRLENYVNHYWLDFPVEFSLEIDLNESQMTAVVLKKLTEPTYFAAEPPNIFNYLNSMLTDVEVGFYPHLADVNNMCRDVIEILSMVGMGRNAGAQTITRAEGLSSSTPRARRDSSSADTPHARAVITAVERGITPSVISTLPPAIGLVILTIVARCKSEPPADWPADAYTLVMRDDLALQASIAHTITCATDYMESLALEVLEKETAYTLTSSPDEPAQPKSEENDTVSGMEHLNTKLLKLLFPRDHRMAEVKSLVQSYQPVSFTLTQRPEVSDHDFIEEQEKHLLALSTRTMAVPVARGMLTLRSQPCSPTEPLSVPPLCVTGRGPPPRCNVVALPAGEMSPSQLLWPTFHNGVAAGLALVPITGSSIDSTWILYNKPKGTADMSAEHAGFLMGLGLNGHLTDMPYLNSYEYFIKGNEMTSIGLLLGIAASRRGTMNVLATKMMAIHLEALLPPTSIELDIQQNILVAALLGVGLLYQGTMHAHYARVLLNEIGKPPGPEMENCVEREGYALAAGLALGLVLAGAARAGRAPDHVAPRLRTYMRGGEKLPLTSAQKEKYKQGSFAIREGATVNLDVTSPGATLALGLIYLRSNNAALAGWLDPPTTAYQLDFVRPDLLMLRIIARGLVLWDSIEASEEWIEQQVPPSIRAYCLVKPTEDNIDYEAMNQAYCNIIAGACFAMGLRFAGSGDEDARDAALYFVRLFIMLGSKPVAELAGRSTLEACMCVCLLAAGMVMAGRGDVSVVRVVRRLRARVTPHPTYAALTHGGQMAVHCTLGLLFVGGCRGTLSTAPTAIGALLAAFFPKFPTHSEDNRYHLQAFRHLYVLAVEPRLILPRDLDTGKLCYVHIQVIDLEGAVKEMRAPCIIPELDSLREVRVCDPRYWPISFQRGRNWDQLRTFLEYTWCIDIKQRAGSLSYVDDPLGFLTILAHSLTLDKSNVWSATPDNIQLFSNDEKVNNFVKHYLTKEKTLNNICADCLLIPKKRKGLKNEPFMAKECSCRQSSKEEREHVQMLSMITYECVVKDILCALPMWTTFLKIIKGMKTDPTSYHIWQIKLLLSHIEHHNKRSLEEMKVDGQDTPYEPLISNEFTLAIKQKVANTFDSFESKISPYLSPYLRKWLGFSRIASAGDLEKKILAAFIVYHDLPRNVLKINYESEVALLLGLDGTMLSAEAASKVGALLR